MSFEKLIKADKDRYLDKAYSVLEANPALIKTYGYEPNTWDLNPLAEELYDIDAKTENPHYDTLKSFMLNNKINVPKAIYSKEPVEWLKNAFALKDEAEKDMYEDVSWNDAEQLRKQGIPVELPIRSGEWIPIDDYAFNELRHDAIKPRLRIKKENRNIKIPSSIIDAVDRSY